MSEDGDRRARLADAAITTVAREGMRGLTHRAVDRTAGVPEGSTSYYFRTRQALLQAAIERLDEMDAAELAALPRPPKPLPVPELAEALAGLVGHWLTAGRERMLARYELALEATRRPELRRVYDGLGARYRGLAAAMLAAAGAAEADRRAPLLVACLDGLIFDRLAGAGGASCGHEELTDALRALLEAFITS